MEFDIIKSLTNEYTNECASTRKLLASVPLDNPSWKPHEKSMSLGNLAIHVADLPNWVPITLERSELDFATEPYNPKKATTTEELLKIHDDAVASALESIKNTTAEILVNENWTMRNGEKIYFTMPKIAVLRSSAFNHLYHHRGQLTVYLRLLGVAVPGMYGPTADYPM
ncbi:MAG TPA: DinB family protein [Chitinophagales bacterium]|nr:DinB family protein [Chitinophagales bacterium]